MGRLAVENEKALVYSKLWMGCFYVVAGQIHCQVDSCKAGHNLDTPACSSHSFCRLASVHHTGMSQSQLKHRAERMCGILMSLEIEEMDI